MSEATVQFVELVREAAARDTARYPLKCEGKCGRVTDHRLAKVYEVDVYTCTICKHQIVKERK